MQVKLKAVPIADPALGIVDQSVAERLNITCFIWPFYKFYNPQVRRLISF